MSPCEAHELSISTLADGELPAAELLPTIDHLLECPTCRAFYRDVRALDAMVAAGATAPQPAPEAVWRRIERRAVPAGRRQWQSWASRAAAALVLAVGALWALTSLAGPGLERRGDSVEVVLGEDRGRMTEERFVEIATELLKADRRFQEEMLHVMSTVTEEAGRREGPADGDAPRPEETSGGGSPWDDRPQAGEIVVGGRFAR